MNLLSYTIGVGDAAKILGVSREAVHLICKRGELSFVERERGSVRWKYLDPDEVRQLAARRAADVNKP